MKSLVKQIDQSFTDLKSIGGNAMKRLFICHIPFDSIDKTVFITKRNNFKIYLLSILTLLLIPFSFLSADSPAKKNYRIAGTIQLPDNLRVTSVTRKSMELYIVAYDDAGGSYAVNAYIGEGENSAPFKIEIPQKAIKKFRLQIDNNFGGYIRSGFYTRNGLVRYYEMNNDCYFDPMKDDLTGITVNIGYDPAALSEKQLIEQADKKGLEIAAEIFKPDYTSFEKIIAAHDYLIDHYTYFTEELAIKHKMAAPRDRYKYNQIFISGLGVCISFSSAFQFLMKTTGIDASIVDSYSQYSHSWNLVKLNGKYYHIDIGQGDHANNYDRLLLNDTQVLNDTFLLKGAGSDFIWDQKKSGVHKDVFVFNESDYIHKKELSNSQYRRIFGNIHLSGNEKAGAEGVSIWIGTNVLVMIPPGANSTFLSIRVPVKDYPDGYFLRYQVAAGNYKSGFYSKKGYAGTTETADKLDLTGLDLTGIEIVLSSNK